jgi:hypothetical protein
MCTAELSHRYFRSRTASTVGRGAMSSRQLGSIVGGSISMALGRLSDPYPEMAEPAENHGPLGRTDDASRQLEQAVRYICAKHSVVEPIQLMMNAKGLPTAEAYDHGFVFH